MKLLILEDDNINQQLIDNAIADLGFSTIAFKSTNDVFEHMHNDSTPFMLISEIIKTSRFNFEKMAEAISISHFRGIFFLTKYSDDIFNVAKQMGIAMGFHNIYGLCLPATTAEIRDKIVRSVASEDNFTKLRSPVKKLGIETIEMALANDLFEPYLQAQVCSSSEKVKGFEVLSRLCIGQHVYMPDTFIDTLIHHERITEFTFTILKKTLRLLEGYNEFTGAISINVDYQSLDNLDFAKKILSTLKQNNFSANRFTVELTEKSPAINVCIMHNLALFRMAGCQLSVDDFGTKSSGFTELLKFPFSELKIDREFVWEMSESPRGYKVVKALCAVAQSLDCEIVAEGVENQQQRRLLRELGAGTVQGYLYSKPVPIHEAIKLISN